jgi:hypothetical protein
MEKEKNGSCRRRRQEKGNFGNQGRDSPKFAAAAAEWLAGEREREQRIAQTNGINLIAVSPKKSTSKNMNSTREFQMGVDSC